MWPFSKGSRLEDLAADSPGRAAEEQEQLSASQKEHEEVKEQVSAYQSTDSCSCPSSSSF